jgi:formylglycine-generating enzyme required for sulfatase activity
MTGPSTQRAVKFLRAVRLKLTAALLIAALPGLSCKQATESAVDAELQVFKTHGGVEMVLIPTGSFEMGNRHGREDEKAVHQVSVAAFWMDKTEVTQAEYERHALPNPSHFKGANLPVEQIKWGDAAKYCNLRSTEDGLQPCYNAEAECNFEATGYRLPTEAEWEYACRAGSETAYSFGRDSAKLSQYAWFHDNAAQTTHPVGQKKPNRWGLYDMHGNVAEWCNDIYDPAYYTHSPAANPQGPAEGSQNVLRGGSWKSTAEALRSSYRLGETPGFSDACLARDAIGFRCVRKQSH